MKRFNSKQVQKYFKLKDSCVELPTHAVFGGGQFSAYFTRI